MVDPVDVKLSFTEAQDEFRKLLDRVKPNDMPQFLRYIKESYSTEKPVVESGDKEIRTAYERLMEIALNLRTKLPISGEIESEKIVWPTEGCDDDCTPENTVNVDCFLYDDEAVDVLVEEGKMSRNYCLDCGSKNTKPLTFISHSLGAQQLEFIFSVLVPLRRQTEGYHVVDIGSRFGTVTSAAALYGNGRARVTGIEMNQELCNLQNQVIKDFDLKNVTVVNSDVRETGDLLKTADLVVMNNVFGFFLSIEEQTSCWEFIHNTLKPGSYILHNPDMKETIAHLPLSFKIKDWVQKVSTVAKCASYAGENDDLFDECSSLHFYKVK